MDIELFLRYSRHLSLPDFDVGSQEKLAKSNIAVIGAGGLGAPVLHYLTAAGVGRIGIIDEDKVELSNLQRQVLFTEEDLDKPKAEVAARRLSLLNSRVHFDVFPTHLSSENALGILEPYQIIIDGTDNFPTRYLINDACILQNKPFIYGSVYRYEGQLSVFNVKNSDGSRGPNYRDLFPEPPPPEFIPNCEEGGVLGVLPGIIGCMQATEAIKLITGIGKVMSGQLLIFDAQTMQSTSINILQKKDAPPIDKLIDYEEFCSLKNNDSMFFGKSIKEISATELKELRESGEEFQLIDVREVHEHQTSNIGGDLMPMRTILDQVEKIKKEGKVVLYCQSGARSASVIRHLEKHFDRDNLYNLKGGIIGWYRSFGSF